MVARCCQKKQKPVAKRRRSKVAAEQKAAARTGSKGQKTANKNLSRQNGKELPLFTKSPEDSAYRKGTGRKTRG